MTRESLVEKITTLVGVSNSESEFAFKIFLENLSKILKNNEAIKIPELGVFQIKEGNLNDDKSTIVFAPSADEFDNESSSMFLTFKVAKRDLGATIDSEDEIFSIGVGKPTVPLDDGDINPDSETSYFMLKRSIDERITELVSNSEKQHDFDLWEEYMTQISDNETEQIDEPKVNDEEFLKDLISDEAPLPESVKEPELTGFDALEKDLEAFRMMAEKELTEEPEEEQTLNDQIDSSEENEEEYIFDTVEDKVDFDLPDEEVKELENTFSEDNSEFDLPDDKENLMELIEKLDEEDDLDPIESLKGLEDPEEIDEEEIDGFVDPSTLEKLDDTEENEETDKNLDIENTDEPPRIITKTKFTGENNLYSPEHKTTEIDEEESSLIEEKFDTKFWLILAGIGTIIIVCAVYFLFISGPSTNQLPPEEAAITDSSKKPELVSNSNVIKDNSSGKEVKTNDNIDSKITGNNNKSIISSPKYNGKKEIPKTLKTKIDGLYKEIPGDRVANGAIYTNGSTFTLQIGSSKSKRRSESEVKRLRALGHNAFLVKVYIARKGGTWYRIRIGEFQTLKDAKDYKKNYKF